MPENERGAVVRWALEAAITGEGGAAADLFTDDVIGWAPNLFVTSLADLSAALEGREGALTDVELTIDALDVVGDKAIAEWRVGATFSGPFLLDDDILIEPTGQPLALAGVVVAEFAGDKIRAFRCYFDDAALLEQMLVGA